MAVAVTLQQVTALWLRPNQSRARGGEGQRWLCLSRSSAVWLR